VGVFGNRFCRFDLTDIFGRGERVDLDDRGMGAAEFIVEGMFV